MPLRGRGRFPGARTEEQSGAIKKYVALQRPGSERAIAMLKDVGAAVKDLMQRHGWQLPVLAEMYPRSANLLGLNINRGAKICLRLRHAGRSDAFLERNEVIGTHNVCGPHNTQFYTTLAQLTEEYDTAQRLGYWPGAGFLTPGVRLGGRDAPLSPDARRARAAEQALQRQRTQQGTFRLGGAAPGQRSLRELAAETCASASQAEIDAVRAETDAAEDGAIVVYDSDEDASPDPRAPSGTRDDPIVL